MATKSIYKSINIRSKSLARGLIAALENAQNKKSPEIQLSRTIEDVKGSDVKKMFEGN